MSRAADYFRRWVARWPTVAALAAASQEEVNEAWAGLGYYRRARYLLEGARHVVEKLDGSFPTTAKELLSIPGGSLVLGLGCVCAGWGRGHPFCWHACCRRAPRHQTHSLLCVPPSKAAALPRTCPP